MSDGISDARRYGPSLGPGGRFVPVEQDGEIFQIWQEFPFCKRCDRQFDGEGDVCHRCSRYYCIGCGKDVIEMQEEFMVDDEVWQNEAGIENMGGSCCVGCLEERIGRSLTPEDFTDAPVNQEREGVGSKSERLLSRME